MMNINNYNNYDELYEPNYNLEENKSNKLTIELNEIKKLSENIEKIFSDNSNTKIPIFNWDFKKEYSNGNIEYKRTLSTYKNKMEKLLRQIYWRIYEGIITENKKKCYYIIGIEDSGIPSKTTLKELEISIEIIKETIINTELNYDYLYLKNTIHDYKFIIIKIWLNNDDKKIEYF